MLEIFGLYLSIKGRINFLQFARFGKFYEQSYRNQFQHNFDFLEFNNIAKITHWISIPKEDRKAFSMSSIKTMYHNQLLINRFINLFGISTNKNNKRIRELVKWGIIAA